jgi:CRP-like cAMP-binding protein
MAKSLVAPRPPPKDRPKNRLLRALPDADFQRLVPDLRTILAPVKHYFHKRDAPIEYVYFPNGGVASITAVLADGAMVETATVGHEGMVGLEAYFREGAVAPGDTMMQVADTNAEQLSVRAFRRELAQRGAMSDLIGRYAEATLAYTMQSVACNARHHIQERCARWLLSTHDRVGGDEFELSHEFLAVMLGVRRQSVTVVAGTLQAARLITYRHGHVEVLDRKGLEAASCECYASIRGKFDALFAEHPRRVEP